MKTFRTIRRLREKFKKNLRNNFELKDMNTGKIIVVDPKQLKISSGKYKDNKIFFEFPDTKNLFQLRATATITDIFGISNIRPIELIYYNYEINTSDTDSLINNLSFVDKNRFNKVKNLAKFLAIDGTFDLEDFGKLYNQLD